MTRHSADLVEQRMTVVDFKGYYVCAWGRVLCVCLRRIRISERITERFRSKGVRQW